jgi:hypothetical protein
MMPRWEASGLNSRSLTELSSEYFIPDNKYEMRGNTEYASNASINRLPISNTGTSPSRTHRRHQNDTAVMNKTVIGRPTASSSDVLLNRNTTEPHSEAINTAEALYAVERFADNVRLSLITRFAMFANTGDGRKGARDRDIDRTR